MKVAERELLMAFHNAISGEIHATGVGAAGKIFRAKNGISAGHSCIPLMSVIYAAHVERCAGRSSPAECDDKVRRIINA